MFLDDMASLIISAGAATVVGTDVFLGYEPDSPDACVMLFEYSGRDTLRASSTSPGLALLEFPRLQVIVRDQDYSVARTTMNVIYKALDHYAGTVNSVVYAYIHALGTPFLLERAKGASSDALRASVSCNFEAAKCLT